jgi:hypothetical protein
MACPRGPLERIVGRLLGGVPCSTSGCASAWKKCEITRGALIVVGIIFRA